MRDLSVNIKPFSFALIDLEPIETYLSLEQKALAKSVLEKEGLLFEEEVLFFYKKRQAGLLPYRYVLARIYYPNSFDSLSPVGVSGIVFAKQSVLIGKRSEKVSLERGLWEFPPSGSVAKSSLVKGKIDLSLALLKELEEETGLKRNFVKKMDSWWVVDMPWGIEYVAAITLESDFEIKNCLDEHVEMAWMPVVNWEEERVKRRFTPLAHLLSKTVLKCF